MAHSILAPLWSGLNRAQPMGITGRKPEGGRTEKPVLFLPLTLSALDHISANYIPPGLQLILVDPFSESPTFTRFR